VPRCAGEAHRRGKKKEDRKKKKRRKHETGVDERGTAFSATPAPLVGSTEKNREEGKKKITPQKRKKGATENKRPPPQPPLLRSRRPPLRRAPLTEVGRGGEEKKVAYKKKGEASSFGRPASHRRLALGKKGRRENDSGIGEKREGTRRIGPTLSSPLFFFFQPSFGPWAKEKGGIEKRDNEKKKKEKKEEGREEVIEVRPPF